MDCAILFLLSTIFMLMVLWHQHTVMAHAALVVLGVAPLAQAMSQRHVRWMHQAAALIANRVMLLAMLMKQPHTAPFCDAQVPCALLSLVVLSTPAHVAVAYLSQRRHRIQFLKRQQLNQPPQTTQTART